MDGLLPALVACTASLGTHIYYSDQIQDLAEEIINRVVTVQVSGLPGRGRHGADRNRLEAIRCLVACLVGLIKATELNKGRITSHIHKEEVAPTEKGKWRESVDGATSDAEKLAVTTSSGRRNPISPEVWQESLAVLAESSFGVRADYARALETYIRTELPPEPYGAKGGIPDDESIKRVHPGALYSKGRQSQFMDATYRFLNAFHASAFTLAVSTSLGLATDHTAGASQASSSQALAPTSINIVPSTPIDARRPEFPPPASEDTSKRTPSRGRSVSGALALLDPNQGATSGYRLPSPSDYAHLVTVLCAMHERLPVRGLFAGVPMLLALDQAASSIADGDGNSARGRKQAIKEVIAQAWITIGKMWECQEVVDAAETALTTLPMPSYIPEPKKDYGIAMDKYLTGSRSQNSSRAPKAAASSNNVRHHPYARSGQVKQIAKLFESSASGSEDDKPKVSSRKLTLAILSSLKDEENPITHSKSIIEHIVSGSSGHQVNDTGGRSSAYIKGRNAMRDYQALERVQDSSVTIFRGLVVYINGYCRGTTDAELKRLIVSGGGKISHSNHGGVTHIITSMQLSAKKTEQFKNGKPRKPTHVVTPEWIKDCYEQRKRLQEWKYNVIDLKNDTHVSG
ncbi:unnamed protein product [Rhizoctonia solani]|uniref:BRCT domain-containing protein n=1 Tax=Rhizoctonia solani TaxID=456999 RepID=A0A8H3HPJ6_9AGAM|nr:unnamed protein product [Rhizoctonia solani]